MKRCITRYKQVEDEALLPYIRVIANQRGHYGYRRITALMSLQIYSWRQSNSI